MARILIVDDSPTQMLHVAKLLKKHQHEILTARDGIEGVEVAQAERPDLILMNKLMPNMNGFQATRQITKNPGTQHIPVIMNSAAVDEKDRIWAMRQGAKDFFETPLEETILIEIVNRYLSKTIVDDHPVQPG